MKKESIDYEVDDSRPIDDNGGVSNKDVMPQESKAIQIVVGIAILVLVIIILLTF